MSLEDRLEERFRRLSAMALGLSLEELQAPLSAQASRPPRPVGLVVDYLDHFEASVAATLLAKQGLTPGRDYALLPEGVEGRFALALRQGVGGRVVEALDKLRELSYAKRAALKILKEWRSALGEVEGDVDEALHAALKVARVKEKMTSRRCPRCGGAVARVVEKARPSSFELVVERTCCGYVERAWVPLTPASSRPRPPGGRVK